MPDLSILPIFMLVFTRCTTFLWASPLMSLPGIPTPMKTGFGFLLTLLIYPLIDTGVTLYGGVFGYGLMLAGEAAIGLGMGYICTVTFNAIRMAGQLIDMNIGFAMSQMMDPATGSMNTLLGRFLYYVTLATFLAVDGHYGLIWGIAKSFELLPLHAAQFDGPVMLFVIRVFADAITLALKVAIPITGVLLMTDIALGMMGRTAPQMNIFMLGFPFKIMLGLVSLAVLLPLLGTVFASIFDQMHKDLLLLVKGLS